MNLSTFDVTGSPTAEQAQRRNRLLARIGVIWSKDGTGAAFPGLAAPLLTLVLPLFLLVGCDSGGTSGGSGSDADPGDGVVTQETGPSDRSAPAWWSELSDEQCRTALRLRSQGLAALENLEWVSAETTLRALRDLLPESRLAVRNYAICRTLMMVSSASPYKRAGTAEEREEWLQSLDAADTAVRAFADITADVEDRAFAAMLTGRLLAHRDSPESPCLDQAVESLRAAVELQPDRADYRMVLADVMAESRAYGESYELLTALQATVEAAPQNLYAGAKYLQRLALSLQGDESARRFAAEQLPIHAARMRELLKPLQPGIVQRQNIDLISQLQNAESGAAASPMAWFGPAMMTHNILIEDLATKIDLRRIQRNLLEYLTEDFEIAFYRHAESTGVPSPRSTGADVVTGWDSGVLPPAVSELTEIAWFDMQDMNLDGYADLVVLRNGRPEVYSAAGSADWRLISEAPAGIPPMSTAVLADVDRDFDREVPELQAPRLLRDEDGDHRMPTDPAGKQRWFDADLDLIGVGESGGAVLHNELQPDGRILWTLADVFESETPLIAVAAGDLEADGDLDIIATGIGGPQLWANLNGEEFSPISPTADLTKTRGEALVVCDWNRDTMIDVLTASSDSGVRLIENLFHNRYRESRNAVPGLIQAAGSELAVSDFTLSGAWQCLSGGPQGLRLNWQTLDGRDQSVVITTAEITSLTTGDYDNDGFLDALIVTPAGLSLWRNTADSTAPFAPVDHLPEESQIEKQPRLLDFDDDGDLDILGLSELGELRVLLNDGGNDNGWVTLVPRAVPNDPQFPANRVNMHGIGGTLQVAAGAGRQMRLIDRPVMHLGLGRVSQPDRLRLIWTDGVPQNVTIPELLSSRLGVLHPQILSGSCPYLYTFDGERIRFFSDCLWAAPLGLVQASGDLAPTREWEHLLIPSEFLADRNGHYELYVTEELRETAYFDELELLAVDHPAGTEIFTNEKVGGPDLAAPKIHTVQQRTSVRSAHLQDGSDVTAKLTSADGDYLRPFQARIVQGLVDEWTLTLDPGTLPQDAPVRLVLTGWVFPTDTSVNVGLQQNSRISAPAPPSLEAVDSDGNWFVVSPFIGFPGGKTKSMVVDLANCPRGADRRVRLRSSMELYFDEAFFIVGDQAVETIAQPCPIAEAALQYRGFSPRNYPENSLFRDGYGPEDYDYHRPRTTAMWPPVDGRLTRYGDVTPLITKSDDQLVVMGPGDDMKVSFRVPEQSPPEGWTRSFVLYCVGWDKDANVSTLLGQSSEPYPFRSMTSYPLSPKAERPDSPGYHSWLKHFQTRQMPRRAFWRIPEPNSGTVNSL